MGAEVAEALSRCESNPTWTNFKPVVVAMCNAGHFQERWVVALERVGALFGVDINEVPEVMEELWGKLATDTTLTAEVFDRLAKWSAEWAFEWNDRCSDSREWKLAIA